MRLASFLIMAVAFFFWNCPRPAMKPSVAEDAGKIGKGGTLSENGDSSQTKVNESLDSLGKIKTGDSVNLASGDTPPKKIDGKQMDSLIIDNFEKKNKASDTLEIKAEKRYDPAPLICEANPGTMGGSGKRGVYELSGDVICWYKDLVFKTSRAIWDRNSNRVNCEGGMEVEANGLILTSERGGYNKGESQIWARQNAQVVDTSGEYSFSADYINYDIEKHLLNLNRKAVLRKFFPDEKDKKNKQGKNKKAKMDTLKIEANKIEYNDSLKWAIAERRVKITRGHLLVTCDSAHFQEDSEVIDFRKNPKANFKHNQMYGDSMSLKLKGEELESMSFVGNAKGDFYEKEDSLKGSEEYHLVGDSMFMKTEKESLEFLEVVQNAKANFIEKKFPDKVNEMEGRYLKLSFDKDKLDSAFIFGAAKTLYYIYEKDVYKGKNVADGDSIRLGFDKGKVSDIFISGRARGSFFGE